MKVLIYRSQGTDEMNIACQNVEEAINCFRADAEAILRGETPYEIELSCVEMTEEQLANVAEV